MDTGTKRGPWVMSRRICRCRSGGMKIRSDTFWSVELVQAIQSQHVNPAWLPKLHVQLDNVSYSCASVVQIAVGAHTISEPDWLQKCAA